MKVRRFYREEARRSPWGMRWYVQGKAKYKYFSTKKDRDEAATTLEKKSREKGMDWLTHDPDEVKKWRDFYMAAHADTAKLTALSAAVEDFLDEKERAVGLRQHDSLRIRLWAFADAHPDVALRAVDAEMVRRWVFGKTCAPLTQNHYLVAIRSFLRWAVRNKFLDENPAIGILPAKVPNTEVSVIPVAAARAFFKAAWKHDKQIARLTAFSAFAGMRSSAVLRLRADDVQKGQGIVLRSPKVGRRDYLEGVPENLWAWSKPFRPWKKCFSFFYTRQRRVEAHAREYLAGTPLEGYQYPHNAWRHSFASYHAACYQTPGTTVLLLTHKGDVGTFWRYYKGRATQADAKAYFEITPESVLRG